MNDVRTKDHLSSIKIAKATVLSFNFQSSFYLDRFWVRLAKVIATNEDVYGLNLTNREYNRSDFVKNY